MAHTYRHACALKQSLNRSVHPFTQVLQIDWLSLERHPYKSLNSSSNSQGVKKWQESSYCMDNNPYTYMHKHSLTLSCTDKCARTYAHTWMGICMHAHRYAYTSTQNTQHTSTHTHPQHKTYTHTLWTEGWYLSSDRKLNLIYMAITITFQVQVPALLIKGR